MIATRLVLFALALPVAASVVSPTVRAADPVLRLDAVAVNLSGVGRTGAQTLEIAIERWSTDEEQKKILDTLVEKRAEDLLDVVQDLKPRAGYIRTRTSLGWDIQFARQEQLSDGSFFERSRSTRSSQYEYLVCEIRLRPDGKGEGKLEAAAKVSYDQADKILEIEDYGTQPVRLTSVTVRK
jgi:hypothetical protein